MNIKNKRKRRYKSNYTSNLTIENFKEIVEELIERSTNYYTPNNLIVTGTKGMELLNKRFKDLCNDNQK